MWIKTVDKNDEYITEYTNMGSGMWFTLQLYGALYLSLGGRDEKIGRDEEIDTRTIWEGKRALFHLEEDCNVYKALIKNVDELLKDGASLVDFQQIIAHILSYQDADWDSIP